LLDDLKCRAKHVQTADDAHDELNTRKRYCIVLLGDVTRPGNLSSDAPVAELEIIKTIRKRSRFKKTKIVVFSSIPYEAKAKQHGANAFLSKPNGAEALTRILEPLLKEFRKGTKSTTTGRKKASHTGS
jgi:CheY-like chemotaxis protein